MGNIAIISDVHANIEALDSVLQEIEDSDIDSVYCLGDIVGYGPNPRECVKRAMDFDQALRGIHEEALLFMSSDFINPDTQRSITWTREELNSTRYESEENKRLWNFIGNLPEVYEQDRSLFVHASPGDPTGTGILPEQMKDEEIREDICSRFNQLLFCGHIHKPYVVNGSGQQLYPSDDGDSIRIEDDQQYVINVGSVGQPRDRDRRACWVSWKDDEIQFHRVSYDFESTMEKIQSIEQLSPFLANRLREGR